MYGEMSEWLKEHAWKACVGETLPWVRIPLSPPSASARVAGRILIDADVRIERAALIRWHAHRKICPTLPTNASVSMEGTGTRRDLPDGQRQYSPRDKSQRVCSLIASRQIADVAALLSVEYTKV